MKIGFKDLRNKRSSLYGIVKEVEREDVEIGLDFLFFLVIECLGGEIFDFEDKLFFLVIVCNLVDEIESYMNLKSFLGSKFFSMELYGEENREFGMIIVFIYVLERRLSLFLDYGLLV